MEEILQIFGQYAFPIACCIYLFWDKHSSDEKHKLEVDALRESLNNNTLVLNKLVDKLEGMTNASN